MNHMEIQEALPELIAGTLETEKEQAVLAHLVICMECRMELAFWAKVAKQMNDEAVPMPREAYQNIKAELFEHEKETMGFFESMETLGDVAAVTRRACGLALSLGGRI